MKSIWFIIKAIFFCFLTWGLCSDSCDQMHNPANQRGLTGNGPE